VATEVAGKLAERKIAWVDSPVSGGVTGAKAGTLAVMVSCPKPAYQKLEPVLKVFGKLFHAGEKPGLAQTAKLANNLLAATAMVATSEAMAMGVKAGLDARVLIDIINASSGRNSASQDKFPRAILPRTLTSASRPASPTRTCGSASRKPRRWACPWWWAAPCARCWR
jgi:3-hydroxyisobutyrate dehydrogenase-like beta-hydroxyacid dehydrogenase